MQDRRLQYYKGNYDQYETTKFEQATNTKRLYDSYAEKRAHMQEFVDKFRANAKRASIVQSRVKAIEKMDAEAPPAPVKEAVWRFTIPAPEVCGDSSFGNRWLMLGRHTPSNTPAHPPTPTHSHTHEHAQTHTATGTSDHGHGRG